jgi:uncharacterized protein (TIGR03118 family)
MFRYHVASVVALSAVMVSAGIAQAGTVQQTNLVSDGSVAAANPPDPNLLNSWGISHSPTSPFWISDNGAGVATLYNTTGAKVPLTVTIPAPAGVTGPSAPDGQAFNGTPGFVVTKNGKSGPALFLFSTEDGTIAGWSPAVDPTNAVLAVDNSGGGKGAVYKGMTLFTDSSGTYLLAANLRAGKVEVYDSTFHKVRSFRDERIDKDFGPFNVQVLAGAIYVTYAKKTADGHDDVGGVGNGFVEQVDIFGTRLRHVHDRDDLNSPWGLAIAPASFGHFAGALLVGNFRDGKVHVFERAHLKDIGALETSPGQALAIDHLWGLIVGNGAAGGDATKVYFTAGPNNEQNGLFGSLTYTPTAKEAPPAK